MKLTYHKKYVSELIADTELHAGGVFFCILYRDRFEFFENGTVEWTQEVVDAFKPMDDMDVRYLENYKIMGTHSFNERGYLVCSFEELFINYTGLATEKDENLIPFSGYNSRISRSWGTLFRLENEQVSDS